MVPISIRPIFIFFLLQKLCRITWLLTGWKKNYLLPEAPWGLRPVAFATPAAGLIRHWNRPQCFVTASLKQRMTTTTSFVSINRLLIIHADSSDIIYLLPAVNTKTSTRKVLNIQSHYFIPTPNQRNYTNKWLLSCTTKGYRFTTSARSCVIFF